jgi:hypothetical protein
MPETSIRRRAKTFQVSLSTAPASAATFTVDGFAGGAVSIGTSHTAVTKLIVYASHERDGDYSPLYVGGSAAEVVLSPSTASGGVYSLPSDVYSVSYVRLAVNSSHGEGMTAYVTVKS